METITQQQELQPIKGKNINFEKISERESVWVKAMAHTLYDSSKSIKGKKKKWMNYLIN